jgi:hypothetical protein
MILIYISVSHVLCASTLALPTIIIMDLLAPECPIQSASVRCCHMRKRNGARATYFSWQVGRPIATCAASNACNILLQHPNETLVTYVRNS